MHLLALDSASQACSAALLADGELRCSRNVLEREHGPMLLHMVDELLASAELDLADLDALAFGCGPGSFTGLRIAAGITQGLAFAADLPVIAVSDLAMLAQGAMDEEGADAVAVCCDARMAEAFTGFYLRDADGLARPLQADALVDPDSISLPDGGFQWHTVGDGWRAFGRLATRLGLEVRESGADRLPDARFAVGLASAKFLRGETLNPEQAIPVYLREEVAWQKQTS